MYIEREELEKFVQFRFIRDQQHRQPALTIDRYFEGYHALNWSTNRAFEHLLQLAQKGYLLRKATSPNLFVLGKSSFDAFETDLSQLNGTLDLSDFSREVGYTVQALKFEDNSFDFYFELPREDKSVTDIGIVMTTPNQRLARTLYFASATNPLTYGQLQSAFNQTGFSSRMPQI